MSLVVEKKIGVDVAAGRPARESCAHRTKFGALWVRVTEVRKESGLDRGHVITSGASIVERQRDRGRLRGARTLLPRLPNRAFERGDGLHDRSCVKQLALHKPCHD